MQKKLTDTGNMMGGLSVAMKEISETERPYEKSYKYGVEILSDAELLGSFSEPGAGEQMHYRQRIAYLMHIRFTKE